MIILRVACRLQRLQGEYSVKLSNSEFPTTKEQAEVFISTIDPNNIPNYVKNASIDFEIRRTSNRGDYILAYGFFGKDHYHAGFNTREFLHKKNIGQVYVTNMY